MARSYLAASKAVEAMGLFQRTTERVAQAEQAWDDLEHPDAQALKDLQALKEQAVVSQQHPLLLTLHIKISPMAIEQEHCTV